MPKTGVESRNTNALRQSNESRVTVRNTSHSKQFKSITGDCRHHKTMQGGSTTVARNMFKQAEGEVIHDNGRW